MFYLLDCFPVAESPMFPPAYQHPDTPFPLFIAETLSPLDTPPSTSPRSTRFQGGLLNSNRSPAPVDCCISLDLTILFDCFVVHYL